MSDSRTRSRRRTIWTIAKITLALILMAFVLSRTSIDDLLSVARRASVGWLMLAAVAFCGSAWFVTLRYWFLIRRQIALSQLFGVVVLQNAISNFAATGLGAASYVAVLRGEHQVTVRRGIASLVLARVGDLIALFPALAVSSYFVWAQIDPLQPVVIAILVSMIVGLIILLLIVSFRQPFAVLVHSLQARFGDTSSNLVLRILGLASELTDTDLHSLYRKLGSLVAYSCLVMASSCFWVYCVVRAFAFPIGTWPIVFVISLTQLMAIVPIQVLGGLGVYEFTSIYLYGLFGINPSEAAALVLGIRIILSVFSLALLLYLPARAWIERRITTAAQ
jgi:uncharacterized protein (TIRG00374 family)